MKVRELIALLGLCDPELRVSVWDEFRDRETVTVKVSMCGENLHIGKNSFGDEIKLSFSDELKLEGGKADVPN